MASKMPSKMASKCLFGWATVFATMNSTLAMRVIWTDSTKEGKAIAAFNLQLAKALSTWPERSLRSQ